MKVKVKIKQHKLTTSFIALAVASMLYNCIMAVAFCYLAFTKDWWAVLLLIPCCTLMPSIKTGNDDDDEEDKDGE